MNKLISHIQAILKEILEELYKIEISIDDLPLETPPKKEMGDYAFPCFGLSKLLKKGPAQIGQEIIDFVKNNEKYNIFSSLEVAGPYLNIRLDKEFLSKFFIENYKDLLNLEDKNNNGKTIVIDYIGANVGKPLHIGHMCTPNQGQVFVNLFRKIGYNVIGDNHWGDWGIIFGKLICAYEKWGDEQKLKKNAVEHLLQLYIKITEESEKDINLESEFREVFKKLSSGDLNYIELWEKFTSYSIQSVNIQLDRLNVKADYNIGESFYEGLGLPKMENYPDLTYDMKSIVQELIKKGIATKNDDGSVGVVFQENTKIPSCILQKRDGTHGYLASDLACVKYRMQNWNPEKIIYFMDVRQQLHLKQVFTISKMAGWITSTHPEPQTSHFEQNPRHPELVSGSGNCKNPFNDSGSSPEGQCTELFHAYNGFISLKDGAMSTRKGRIIKLEALLDEAESRAKKIILEKREDFSENELNNLSKIIGIGAIKYGYLSKNRTLDTIFDWDEFMTFEGNSGPYIQYAYVRARNIIENAKQTVIASDSEAIQKTGNNIVNGLLRKNSQGQKDTKNVIFDHDEEIDLAKELFNYKSVLAETASTYYPHILCNYAYNLTKKFNSFYNKVHILSEENKSKKQLKLLLVDQFSQVLKDSFEILGIEMPEKM